AQFLPQGTRKKKKSHRAQHRLKDADELALIRVQSVLIRGQLLFDQPRFCHGEWKEQITLQAETPKNGGPRFPSLRKCLFPFSRIPHEDDPASRLWCFRSLGAPFAARSVACWRPGPDGNLLASPPSGRGFREKDGDPPAG